MKGLTLKRIAEVTGGAFRLSFLNRDGSVLCVDAQNLVQGDGTACQAIAPAGIRTIVEERLHTEVSSIVTDSRKAGAGSLFGAIAGARADGNDFIPAVFAQGAVCVLTERMPGKETLFGEAGAAVAAASRKAGGSLQSTMPGTGAVPQDAEDGDSVDPESARAWIHVENTVAALGRIAEEYLKLLEVPVVGITGSVGKTSTKEMIATVLSKKLRICKTEGNFNNDLGLPLTVFRLAPEDEAAVLEMGISHFGDMTTLAKIAHPSRMVITNIGTCHLEFLKDRRGVFQAKTEVFDYLQPGAQVFLNGNDDLLRQVSEAGGKAPFFFGVDSRLEGVGDLSAGPVIAYPADLPADRCVTVTSIRPLGFDGSECTIATPAGEFTATVPVPGVHNCSNAAAAAAVGLSFGMSLEEIREGIESARTLPGRFRIVKTSDRTVIDDCYNANPVSMKSSLLVLAGAGGRRFAVLGDMGELGENELALHEDVGAFAASCVDRLIAIGQLSHAMYEAARKANPALSASWYGTVEEFLADQEAWPGQGDTVLVKASHFMRFERIVEALT